jgi:hypothetical protein
MGFEELPLRHGQDTRLQIGIDGFQLQRLTKAPLPIGLVQ